MKKKKRILIVIGTRPEIIKNAPLIREIIKRKHELWIIHTGQHYDYDMSESFFKILKLPVPNFNLETGSASDSVQLAIMIKKLEKIVINIKPDVVLAQGDTNSVLAASLVCSKLNVTFGHVEAGIRSYDLTMAEEINRRIAGVCSHFHFAPSKIAVINLLSEGVEPRRIFLTGNTIVDATIQHLSIAKTIQNSKLATIKNFLGESQFILCTLHRPSNVDNKAAMIEILLSFRELLKRNIKIIFPIHPRTVKNLKIFGLWNKFQEINNLLLTEPLDYLTFLKLMSECTLILTDSGGIQEEAVTLGKKCVTLRTNTERPETLELGINILCKTIKSDIIQTIEKQLSNNSFYNKQFINPYGDGHAACKIIDILEKNQDLYSFSSPVFLEKGAKFYKLVKINETIDKDVFEKNEGIIKMTFDIKGNAILTPRILKKGYCVVVFT